LPINLEKLMAYGWFMMVLRAGCRLPVAGLLGMAAFSCASLRYVAISGKNPLESCVPFARPNIAISQTLTSGMRTHGTGRGGSAVQ
jgi:hypothetical protein